MKNEQILTYKQVWLYYFTTKQKLNILKGIVVALRLGLSNEKISKALKYEYNLDSPFSHWIIKQVNRKLNPCKKKKYNRNPPVEIYSNLLEIRAIKGENSLWKNEAFKHSFKEDSEASIYGLPDGSLHIKSKKGKNLWKVFNY